MTEKLVIKTWWILTLSLVGVRALASLMTAYFGLFSLVATHWFGGTSQMIASIMLAAFAYFLCQYREDLVGD